MTEAVGRIAETAIRVRYAETDAMGIVHHSSYVVWFEAGRSDWMRLSGRSYSEFERDGFFLPVTEISVRYLAPLRYDETAVVRTWISGRRSRQLTFSYEVVDDSGRQLATGLSVHVCTTRDGKVTALPATLLGTTPISGPADARSSPGSRQSSDGRQSGAL